jgi:hypothetical protein
MKVHHFYQCNRRDFTRLEEVGTTQYRQSVPDALRTGAHSFAHGCSRMSRLLASTSNLKISSCGGMSLMSLVNENVFKAVSEDEAMRARVSSPHRQDGPLMGHVQVALSIAI